MTLIPLDIPAGVYKNGTDLEGQGRWQDASLVRWRDNTLRPVGGWQSRKTGFSTNPIRGFHTWEANDGSRFYAGGSYNELKVATSDNTVYDITPTDLTDGDEHSTLETGYGYGNYNVGTYGTERSAFGSYSEANSWQLDNFGEYLTACSYADGRLFEWQLEAPATATYFPLDDAAVTQFTSSNPNFTWATGYKPDSQNPANSGIESATASGTFSSTYRRYSNIPIKRGAKYIAKVIFGANSNVNYTFYVQVSYDNGASTTYFYSNTYQPSSGVPPTPTVDDSFIADDDGTATIYFGAATENSIQFNYTFYSLDINDNGNAFRALPLENAPTGNLGVVVTEERIVFALGAGNNPRKVQWCDIEDNTAWTPTVSNQAGDIELQTAGQIMQGIRTRGQVLILTDIDAHSARYSGPPFVYGFQRVGTACGAISRMAAVDTDAGVFWMGQRGFFRFDGNVVQEMPCDVFDHVFGELQDRNKSKTWAFNNLEFGEVWWFYQSEAQNDTGEIDKYVAYDYKENHWHIGSLSRTAGAPRGVFRNAFMVDSTDVYHHEVAGTGATGMFAETGPIQLGNGDNIMHVTQMIADERTKGDVQLKFKTRFYPNGDETEHGPFDPATPTGLRLAGRQLKMRIEPDDGSDFRVGIVRVDAQQGGKR